MTDIVERLRIVRTASSRVAECLVAADEIERLRADVESMTRAYQMERKACFDLTEKVIPNLRETCAALERDAARYRWLRERVFGADFSYGDGDEARCVLVFDIPDDMQVSGDLDRTLDAAMKL